ncbi:hypothetical protein Tdes44962_MAKER10202, partial [Teratosphaeria destructans]
AEVGEADLEVPGPSDVVVGEEVGAHVRDADREVAHVGQAGEELADVFAGSQVAGPGVVEAIGRARGVLEDLEGLVGGLDEGQHACDGDGGQVGDVQAFQVRRGAGHDGQVAVAHGFVERVAEDLQPLEGAEVDARILERARCLVGFEGLLLLLTQALSRELDGLPLPVLLFSKSTQSLTVPRLRMVHGALRYSSCRQLATIDKMSLSVSFRKKPLNQSRLTHWAAWEKVRKNRSVDLRVPKGSCRTKVPEGRSINSYRP